MACEVPDSLRDDRSFRYPAIDLASFATTAMPKESRLIPCVDHHGVMDVHRVDEHLPIRLGGTVMGTHQALALSGELIGGAAVDVDAERPEPAQATPVGAVDPDGAAIGYDLDWPAAYGRHIDADHPPGMRRSYRVDA